METPLLLGAPSCAHSGATSKTRIVVSSTAAKRLIRGSPHTGLCLLASSAASRWCATGWWRTTAGLPTASSSCSSSASACWSRRQSAAFGKDLHILDCSRELCGSPHLVRLAGGIICERRVVPHQCVKNRGCRRGQRSCFQRAVIEDIRLPGCDGLRVRIGKFGFSNQNLSPNGTDGADFTILARSDRAGDTQPFGDIAVLTDPLPDFGSGFVHVDFEKNGSVSRIGNGTAARRSLTTRRRSLCTGNACH